MKYILGFENFLEGNFFDNSRLTSNKDKNLYKKINNLKNQPFKNDMKLLQYINIEDSKINIKWYHNKEHNLINRIINRTSFNSISEVNSYIKDIIIYIINNKYNDIKIKGKYSIFDSYYNISLIIDIDILNLEFTIITFISGNNSNNFIKKFEK